MSCTYKNDKNNKYASVIKNNTLKLILATSLHDTQKHLLETGESDCSLFEINSDDDYIQCRIIKDSLNNINNLLNEAASLLTRQWPRGGTEQDYIEKMTSNCHGLPASYLLVKVMQHGSTTTNDNNYNNDMKMESNDFIEQQRRHHHQQQQHSYELIGHGRLTECYESLAGNAAAATYIVIHEKYRTMGYGRQLMQLLEEEAKHLGYHYMYLWTNTAIEFYKKLYYQETERVSLHRACLKPLQCDQVNRLEDMLRDKMTSMMKIKTKKKISKEVTSKETQIQLDKKYKQQATSIQTKMIRAETVLLPPTAVRNNNNDNNDKNDDDDNNPPNEEDVWLRKRLVECIDTCSKLISIDDRIQEIKDGIVEYRLRRRSYPQQQSQQPSTNMKDNHNKCDDDNCHSTATVTSYEWRYHYIAVPWQQQIGPSCGLAALRMVRDYYYSHYSSRDHHHDNNNTTNTNTILMPSLLKEAIQLGYTNDGEIFDANNLVQLGKNVCGLDLTMHSLRETTVQDIVRMIHGCDNHNDQLQMDDSNKKDQDSGRILIVPYDTNKRTKLPCNKSNGMNAHYGIIVGIVFGTKQIAKHQSSTTNTVTKQNENDDDGSDNNDTADDSIIIDTIVDGWFDFTTSTSCSGNNNNNNSNNIDDHYCDDVLLLVQHGLSSKLSIASFDEFVSSNQQLTTYDEIKYRHVTKLNLQDCLIQCHGIL